jgi:hypothetical protein
MWIKSKTVGLAKMNDMLQLPCTDAVEKFNGSVLISTQ